MSWDTVTGTTIFLCGKCNHPMHWHECGAGASTQTAPCGCRNDQAVFPEAVETTPEERLSGQPHDFLTTPDGSWIFCRTCGVHLPIPAPPASNGCLYPRYPS